MDDNDRDAELDADMGFDADGLDIVEWAEDFAGRLQVQGERIRASDALVELRASSAIAGFEDLDDGDLIDIMEETLSYSDVTVQGERDDRYQIVDPSQAWITTYAAILQGRKLTYRITGPDAANRILPLAGSVGVIDADIVGGDFLYDAHGDPLDRHIAGYHSIAVPAWVDGFDEGRVAVLSRQGDTLHIDVIDDDDLETDGADEMAPLLAGFEQAREASVGLDLTESVYRLIMQDPDSFTRATPPIDELLRANGFDNRGDWWGPTDLEWKTPGDYRQATKVAIAASRYGLNDRAGEALGRVDEIWRAWWGFHTYGSGDESELDVAELCELFELELVPLAFFDLHSDETAWLIEAQIDGLSGDAALTMFVDEVNQHAPDSIAALLLTGWAHEITGRARAAELAFKEVVRRHTTNMTGLAKCMEAAVDASRFDEAARLTQRLFGPGSQNEETLQSYVDAMVTAGRNEPCPCGSGRKFKQCHQGESLLPEPHLTRALLFKLEMFAEKMALRGSLADGGGRGLARELVHFPEARSFIMFEGGMLDQFLQSRIELIPPAELERLRGWQTGRRGLYEVMAVDPGQGMTLRDVATDEHIDLVEERGSSADQVGEFLLLRLETIDGEIRSYSQGMLVPAADTSRVLAMLDFGEVDELLQWFAERLVPADADDLDDDLDNGLD